MISLTTFIWIRLFSRFFCYLLPQCTLITLQTCDGSGVKNFRPGSGRVRSAIFGLGLGLENFPLKSFSLQGQKVFLTQPEEIFFLSEGKKWKNLESLGEIFQKVFNPTRRDFFYPKGKKWKNLGFLGEIFQIQTKDGWPDSTRTKQQKIDP